MKHQTTPDILPHGNRKGEFAEQAKYLRAIADDIEKGKVLAAAWVTIERENDGRTVWSSNRFKARGVSSLELQGAWHQALHELAQEDVPK